MPYGLNMDMPIKVRLFAYKYFRPDEWHCTRVCQDDVILLMLEGTLYFRENGKEMELHPGEYYIQRRQLPYDSIRPSPGAVYYYMHFTGEYCENPNALPLFGYMDPTQLRPCFTRLNHLKITHGSQMELYAEVYKILSLLKQGIHATEYRRTVNMVIDRVSEDYRKRWTLEELARISGYSVNHLIEIFRRETGCTPYAYIREMRMQAAQALLLNSELSLGHISEDCGFGSYVNFYKTFMQVHGMPPQLWRQSHRDI